MKNSALHYRNCVAIYQAKGYQAVFDYCQRNGISEQGWCRACEMITPAIDGECMVCGSLVYDPGMIG